MIPDKNVPGFVYDLIIIGAGPSGLTAGLYASRARLKVLLFEDPSTPIQTNLSDLIENYPGFPEGIKGYELMDRIKNQVNLFDLKIKSERVEGIKSERKEDFNMFNIKTENGNYNSLAVIIASGAKLKELGISGEDKFRGKGVSYCATCDGAFFQGKDIVVIGGGDTAIEEVLFLTKFAKKVTLIHRRNRLRATKILQERVFSNDKIEFIWDSQIIEITGKEKLEKVKVKNVLTNKQSEVLCSGVFIFVGYIPNTEFIKENLDLDEKGYIITDDNMKTSQDGIFACGDCRKKSLRQIVTACGDGATAAFLAQHYIEKLKGTEYK